MSSAIEHLQLWVTGWIWVMNQPRGLWLSGAFRPPGFLFSTFRPCHFSEVLGWFSFREAVLDLIWWPFLDPWWWGRGSGLKMGKTELVKIKGLILWAHLSHGGSATSLVIHTQRLIRLWREGEFVYTMISYLHPRFWIWTLQDLSC